MEQITAKEIADFILGLNALIICLALPCWVIGGFIKALFETIEDIIDQLRASIDNRRFRKHYEKEHPDIQSETSELNDTGFIYYVLIKTLKEKTEESRTQENRKEENKERF